MFARTNGYRKLFLLLPLIFLFSASAALAQGTAFTFQGKLGDSGSPVNGSFDMRFTLFDAPFDPANPNSSTQIGTTIPMTPVQVTNGVFTVQLDFGEAALPGADRFLEIAIRRNSSDPFTPLLPRSKITSSPYAIRSKNATDADGLSSSCVGCIQSSHISSVDASKLAGSFDICCNGTLGGTLSANVVSAATISGNGSGLTNLSASNIASGTLSVNRGGTGLDTPGPPGSFLKSGGSNWFSSPLLPSDLPGGSSKYIQNTLGIQPSTSFFIGGDGSVSGTLSGSIVNANTQYNLAGHRVLAIGGNASSTFLGFDNGTATTGGLNSFFGSSAGQNVTTGVANSFFGSSAGQNSTGSTNSFFGDGSGRNTSGNNNSFFGEASGFGNTSGSNNTLVGALSNVGSSGLTFATAIGAGAVVSSSNRIALGRSNHADSVEVPGPLVLRGLQGGLSTPICLNNNHEVALCLSSSLRFKTDVTPFSKGLEFVQRLAPISFKWKRDGAKDVGFGAEDVAKIDPLFVIYNPKGEIEGVRYDRLSVAFVNAFKEQQAQIEQQRVQIESLRTANAALNSRLRSIERRLRKKR